MSSMTKYVVVERGAVDALTIGDTIIQELPRDRGWRYCGFDSLAEAAKGITGAGDYLVAIENGATRPLNRKEQREFDRLNLAA